MRSPACLLVFVLLAPRTAGAQAQQSDDDKELARLLEEEVYVAELRAPGRLVVGFDFGIGFIDATCGGCYPRGGLSLDGFAGVQVARRVALLADVWTVNHLVARDDKTQESGFAIHALQTAAARVWIIPRLWVQAGGGLGWFNITGDRDGFLFGPAAMIAVGGEPGHKRCRGTDLSLRIGGTRVREDSEDSRGHMLLYSATAVVGFHWN